MTELHQKVEKWFLPKDPDELTISFYEPLDQSKQLKTAVSKTKFKKGMIPDVAIVSRKSAAPLTLELADHDNRFAAWCTAEKHTCYVSVHMPFTATPEELSARCSDMRTMAVTLYNKGFTTVNFAGDYNTNASRMASVCGPNLVTRLAKNVEFHTSIGEKPNSCGSNQGHQGKYNIDVNLVYEFKR